MEFQSELHEGNTRLATTASAPTANDETELLKVFLICHERLAIPILSRDTFKDSTQTPLYLYLRKSLRFATIALLCNRAATSCRAANRLELRRNFLLDKVIRERGRRKKGSLIRLVLLIPGIQ